MSVKSVMIIAVMICVSSLAIGQKDYAVLFKGDTLKGEIKIFSIDKLDRVQINTGRKKLTYTALQVKNLHKDEVTYQPVKYDNTVRFMQLLKSGYLSIYAFNASGLNRWDGRYLLKKDGSGMEAPFLSFKKFLSQYLADCPEIADRVEKGEFSRKNIDAVVDLYNACLQSKSVAMMETKSSTSTSFNSEKILAITKLSEKVEAAQNFLTKKDVTDLLNDIKAKVSANQVVPNYLIEGLKSYLTDTPDLLKEAEELIVLLKK